MKKAFIAIALGIFLVMTVGSVYALEVFQCPTELIQYDSDKAYPGYVLFNPFQTHTQYLIDMQGNVVHTWDTDYTQAFMAISGGWNFNSRRSGPDCG